MFLDSQACFFAIEIISPTLLLVVFTTSISVLYSRYMYCYANVKKASYSPAAYPQSVKCVKYQKEVATETITILSAQRRRPTRSPFPHPRFVKPRAQLPLSPKFHLSPPLPSPPRQLSLSRPRQPQLRQTPKLPQVMHPARRPHTHVHSTNQPRPPETQTSTAASAAVYAACASNNIIGAANGNQGIDALTYNQDSFTYFSATTPYDCCVAFQQAANCVYSKFYFGICEFIGTTTCTPGGGASGIFQTSGGFSANGSTLR